MRFTAGFKLAWGMAKELEADGFYSFEREEEEHICVRRNKWMLDPDPCGIYRSNADL